MAFTRWKKFSSTKISQKNEQIDYRLENTRKSITNNHILDSHYLKYENTLNIQQ